MSSGSAFQISGKNELNNLPSEYLKGNMSAAIIQPERKTRRARIGTNKNVILNAYKILVRATQREVKEFTGYEINIVSARTNELVKSNLLRECGGKKDYVSKRIVHVYAYNNEAECALR